MLARAAFSISVSKKRRIQRRLVVLLFKCSPRTHTCIPWCNNQVPPLPPLPLYLHQHFLPLSNFKHYIFLSFVFPLQNCYLIRTVCFLRKADLIDLRITQAIQCQFEYVFGDTGRYKAYYFRKSYFLYKQDYFKYTYCDKKKFTRVADFKCIQTICIVRR